MPADLKLSEDAHNRVAILFKIPGSIGKNATLVALSVKWLLVHGVPTDSETNEKYEYEGTHIIQ